MAENVGLLIAMCGLLTATVALKLMINSLQSRVEYLERIVELSADESVRMSGRLDEVEEHPALSVPPLRQP